MHRKSKNIGENEHEFFHCEQNSSNLKKMNQIYSNKEIRSNIVYK